MASLTMNNILVASLCLISMVLVQDSSAAETCVQHGVYDTDTYHTCTFGCCYSYIYPCCDPPIGLIMGGVFGGICAVVMFIMLIVCLCKRGTRANNRGQVIATGTTAGNPGTIHQTTVIASPPYANQGFQTQQYGSYPPQYPQQFQGQYPQQPPYPGQAPAFQQNPPSYSQVVGPQNTQPPKTT